MKLINQKIRTAAEFNGLIKKVQSAYKGWGDPNGQSGLKIEKATHAYLPQDLGGDANCAWGALNGMVSGGRENYIISEYKTPTFSRCISGLRVEFTGVFWERSNHGYGLETKLYDGDSWDIECGKSAVVVFRCKTVTEKGKDALIVSVLYYGHCGDYKYFCSATPHQ